MQENEEEEYVGAGEAMLSRFSYLTEAFTRALDEVHQAQADTHTNANSLSDTGHCNSDDKNRGGGEEGEKRQMIEDCLHTLHTTQQNKSGLIHAYDDYRVKLKTLHKEYGNFRGNWAVHVAQHGALTPYGFSAAGRSEELLLRPAVVDAVTSELLIRSLTRGRTTSEEEEKGGVGGRDATMREHAGWYYTDLRKDDGDAQDEKKKEEEQQQRGTLCDEPSRIAFTVDLHPCPSTALKDIGSARAAVTTSAGDVAPELESMAVASLNAQLHHGPNPLREFLKIAIVNKANREGDDGVGEEEREGGGSEPGAMKRNRSDGDL